MTRKEKANRLNKLRKHWHRANRQERLQFLSELRSQVENPNLDRSTLGLEDEKREPIANGRYLLPSAVGRIETILRDRKIGPAELVAEIGFPEETMAMTKALARGRSLRLMMISALATWLNDNEATAPASQPDK
ncbi:hypothetical protein MUU53_18320 [Rhizobium lemnae]|uniref:Uncharacterized protein n=1 Tax=Rhizobium lemnae TaxID=1214924 RepID=A0ABV8E7D9_9HYPH|nr:hypothetical protein [Rhizobium lemnae]MCJ8509858.1 hypothetical protein [Rhizobium lemnae]